MAVDGECPEDSDELYGSDQLKEVELSKIDYIQLFINFVFQHDCCGLRSGAKDWDLNENYSCTSSSDYKCSVPDSCCIPEKVGTSSSDYKCSVPDSCCILETVGT